MMMKAASRFFFILIFDIIHEISGVIDVFKTR